MQSHDQVYGILKTAASTGLNVLLVGPHGVGKTALLTGVANDLGLRMKYYSSSTLDPFVDLVGLPVPHVNAQGKHTVMFHRPDDINQAELVFFDELNRAQPKVLNAVFEMIQFRSINGEPLPNLKAVFAACNPASEEYNVADLDPALLDRFHIHMTFAPGPDREWYIARFGKLSGAALYDWWAADLKKEQQSLVSPRKLEHIGILLEKGLDPKQTNTHLHNLPFGQLQARIANDHGVIDIKDFLSDPKGFAAKVEQEMNVAIRFAHLLPSMKPADMCKVRDITLSLPTELIATLQKECPFVVKKTCEAIKRAHGEDESAAFRDLILEKSKVGTS
jgi:ATPase family associated with various cellular activities (AAA)